MTKLDAMTKLMSGEISEMVSPDGKSAYMMMDGAIQTSRKKALVVKDMMEDGWEGKTPLNWKDHIGSGVLVTTSRDGIKVIEFVSFVNEEGEPLNTEGQPLCGENPIPATAKDLEEFIWNEATAEKKSKKAKKADGKPVEKTEPDVPDPKDEDEIAEEVDESDVEPDTDEADESEAALAESDVEEEMGKPEQSPQPSKKNTVPQKEEAGDDFSGVNQRRRYFISLGIPAEEWESFFMSKGLTNDNIEAYAARDIKELQAEIKEYMEG